MLTLRNARVAELAAEIERASLPGVAGVHVSSHSDNKDRLLRQQDHITVSTVASSKGYDSFVVLFASANQADLDPIGRATFYVGCTRAIEHLEVFGNSDAGLLREMQLAVQKVNAAS